MKERLRSTADIAIIGMAGRFPGARDIGQFWANLVSGTESIRVFSDQELLEAGEPLEDIRKPNYVKAAPTLDDIELFDASFFGFSPREADIRDPQHRVFLEICYEAIQQAGYDRRRLPGLTGVFGGVYTNRYAWLNVRENPEVNDGVGAVGVEISNNPDYLATLVSYKLNLRGPSFTVVTACSTSLVATHLACRSLRSAECDLALAGGVEIELPQHVGYWFSEGGMFARDGHCRSFDAGASGTIFGSGAGVVVLKRLEDAVSDRDTIYAVIRGSAINNDGDQKAGFTAPSVAGQQQVVAQAYKAAGIDPETVTYVEAHGTATTVGDPVEVAALSEVFMANTGARNWCALGSVKTNVGHLGPAAGVASLIKTTLALTHGAIPPHLNYESPNPKIDFANSPFYVNTELQRWPSGGAPRRAGVSSFGIGGTNAHLVLEEGPKEEPSSASRPHHLLLLSAKTEAALEAAGEALAHYLEDFSDFRLPDAAYTLQVGREEMPHRRIVVCESAADAVRSLSGADSPARMASGVAKPNAGGVVFMFPGQGAQHVHMAADLYEHEQTFRAHLAHCAELLSPRLGFDLLEVLYPSADRLEKATELLVQTRITQPALFAVEYALAQLWMEWGVRPRAMVGHSIGEYVAACLAGVFGLEEVLRLVAARGAIMQELPPGAMLAIPAAEEGVRRFLDGKLSLAAVNGPELCVVSGPESAVAELEARLGGHGLPCTRLRTSHAFHSAMMDPVRDSFARMVREASPQSPDIPFVSNLTGTWITPAQATDPEYWAQHLRDTVRFADGLRTLMAEPSPVLLEVGPGQTLTGLARMQPEVHQSRRAVPSLRHPNSHGSDEETMLHALGRLWLTGVSPDWEGFYAHETRRRVSLPTYPFQRRRHWVDPIPKARQAAPKSTPGARLPMDEWFSVPVWRQSAPLLTGNEPSRAATWLLFGEADGLPGALAAALAARGDAVVTVKRGEGFASLGEGCYAIDPRQRGDYDALMDALQRDEQPPTDIVHMWTALPLDPAQPELDASAEAEELGFFSLCSLAHALPRRHSDEALRLTVISSSMQDVLGGEAVVPARAAVLGPCAVIPKESSNTTCRSIDVRLQGAGSGGMDLAERLVAELTSTGLEDVVAYRGSRRWVRAFEPIHLDESPESVPCLKQKGTYLITGGVGAVGLVLAEQLAREYKARLALVGRSTFPEPEGWDHWLETHEDGDRVSGQIRKLRQIESLGGQVVVLSADITDPAQVSTLLATVSDRFDALNGVIHAAGLGGGGMLALKSREMTSSVLAPKVRGTQVLAAALRDVPLDFFLLCSSLVSVTGDFGLGDYCAANNVLDVSAHAMAKDGCLTIAFDWPAWLEVGMAVEAAEVPVAFRELQKGATFDLARHPLLDKRIVEPSGDILYSTALTPVTHWVVEEHRVLDRSVLPGVAYLELALAALAESSGEGVVEIRDVIFLAPLAIGERREVRTLLRPASEGWEFTVAADADSGVEAGGPWQEFARGSLKYVDSGPAPDHDLQSLRARCNLGEVRVRGNLTRGVVTVGLHWDCIERVLLGNREELVVLEMPEAYCGDLSSFGLHPALLDCATSFGQTLVPAGDYLPFGYGSVTVRAPLPRRFFSHIKQRGEVGDGADFITTDIVLIDESGVELVRIDGFTLRRVEPAAVGDAMAPASKNGAAVRDGVTRGSFLDQRAEGEMAFAILSDEAVEVFRRVLAARIQPQVVICPEGLQTKLERSVRVTQDRILEDLAGVTLVAAAQVERNLDNPYLAPTDEIEQTLAGFWQEALGVNPVGVEDDFFELGGNSLVAVQLASRVRDRFKIELPLPTLFESPTVRKLARLVQAALLAKVEVLSESDAAALLAGTPSA